MNNNIQGLPKSLPNQSKDSLTSVLAPTLNSQITQLDNSSKNANQSLAVFLRGVTWLRDSHGLFDYESKSINKKSMKTCTSGKIVRIGDDIELTPIHKSETEIGQNVQCLLQIKNNKNIFFLDHQQACSMEEDSTDRLWLVIRSLKSPEGKYDYKIKKFDVIKLGRVKFRVKDFACEFMGQTPEELYNQELKEAQPVITLGSTTIISETGTQQCKFCWESHSTSENPCIVPCRCSGSVGFIHYQCLKTWLAQKMNKRESNELTSIYYKTFECEICKFPYPYLFKVDQKVFKLLDIQQPKSGHFMVLESLPLEKNSSRTIHVLNFSQEKQTFNMGRGHESEVRVNDISVSRCHAIIKYQPDGIYIEDNRSKFGTLVLLKEQYNIQLEYTSAVQIGRTVVSFTVRNTAVEKVKGNEEGGIIPIGKAASLSNNAQNQIFQVQKGSQSKKLSNPLQPKESNMIDFDDELQAEKNQNSNEDNNDKMDIDEGSEI